MLVVSSFANYYKNRLWRNEVAFKKEARRKQLKVRHGGGGGQQLGRIPS